MANVEIYDSSDSNLSSDEYSPEEDDLMDAAVSNKPRQQQEGTPKRTSSTGSSKNNLTLEEKQQQQLQFHKNENEDGKEQQLIKQAKEEPGPLKPPSNPLQTQLQIKQLKRSNRSSFYFKRRSLLWLRRLQRFPDGYLRSLKYTVMRFQSYSRRSNPRRDSMVVKHAGSSPSRSRSRSPASRSVSQSPELICLDDTENEESPEKLEAAVKRSAMTPVKYELGPAQAQAPPTRKLKLDEDDKAPDPVPPQLVKENGSILDEFLTLKASSIASSALASVPNLVNPPHPQHIFPSPYDLTVAMQVVTQEIVQSGTVDANNTLVKEDVVEVPQVLESTLKRRRSLTPPSLGEKRVKSMPVDSDDDTLEFAKPEPAEQPQPQPQTHQQLPQLESPVSMPKITTEEPIFKLGPAFTLAPEEEVQPLPVQQQAVDLAGMSYSLSTPTPPPPPASGLVEPMEISYPNIVKQKVLLNKVMEIQSGGSLVTPPPINTPINPLVAFATFTAPQPPQKPRRSETVYTQTTNNSQEATSQTAAAPSTTQMPGPPTSILTSPPPPLTTSLPPPAAATPRPQKSYPDLTNSDANFHYRIKELYSELDTIINDKLNSLTPELQSFMDERKRIDADIKTLDKLIGQKEEETNRLIHLRCVKEELRSRLERKERVLIIKDILPMLVNKNCSTPELYEMHSMLLEEQNAPITPKHGGPSALERCINQLESSQNNLRLLRGALNLKEPSSGLAQCDEAYRRRSSLPAGRREMQECVGMAVEDHIEEMPPPLLSKRSKQLLQIHQQSKYQHLLVGNSTPNLVAADNRASSFSSHPNFQHHHLQQRSLRNSFDNHFERETAAGSLKPLYNSSPMLYNREGGGSQSNYKRGGGGNGGTLQHSIYQTDEMKREREDDGQKADRKPKESRPSMNGGGGGGGGSSLDADRRCQHCERSEANFMCASCQNQWYCSRDCQLRAWDAHWEQCVK